MNQRVRVIDGLRGFSLIGILIANMLIFQYGMFGKDRIENFLLSSGDHVAYVWTKIFVENSFIPIFMFLFGYSIIKLKEQLEKNDKKVKRHFVRRFFLLMIIGLLHSFFIWEGDILMFYGLMGFFMLIFLNRKKKTMLVWAILIFAATSLLGFVEYEETAKEVQSIESYIEKETTAYSSGSYKEIYEFRNNGEDPFGYPAYYYLFLPLLAPIVLSPLFLLGMYAAKSNWFKNPNKERRKYTFTAVLFCLTGLSLKSSPYLIDQSNWTEGAYGIGSTFLAIGYIFAFALLYTKAEMKFLSYFEQVGRLSMTNYLFQSIICTTIFYGYGIRLFGNLGVFKAILLAIFIFGLQVVLSNYYLKLFKMGPFEKIMRMGTYLSWNGQPKKKRKKALKIKHGKVSVPHFLENFKES